MSGIQGMSQSQEDHYSYVYICPDGRRSGGAFMVTCPLIVSFHLSWC